MQYKVKEVTELLGISKSTLYRLEKQGKIIPTRTNGNHRRYDENIINQFLQKKEETKITIAYARVSPHDQKEDLERQITNISNYCIAKRYQFKVISDLGSGLNYKKKGLQELINLICNNKINKIVIIYKDRLIRYGYEIIESFCKWHNVNIEIINLTENKAYEQELVEDMLAIVTVFSSRLYGSRSHENKKEIECIKRYNK